jgi:hypothetical protein
MRSVWQKLFNLAWLLDSYREGLCFLGLRTCKKCRITSRVTKVRDL